MSLAAPTVQGPRPLSPIPKFVSVAKAGRVITLPHDGTIPVNGGRELVYSEGGRLQHRTARRCVWCSSRYHVYGDATLLDKMFYCPACYPTRIRFLKASTRDAHRPRARMLREAVRERRPPLECRHCGAGISLTLARASAVSTRRYCSPECKQAAAIIPDSRRKRELDDPSKFKNDITRTRYARRMAARREAPPRTCLHCSAIMPIETSGLRKYCSDTCRVVHNEAARRGKRAAEMRRRRAEAAASAPPPAPRHCRTCGRDMPAGSPGQRWYCSATCRPSHPSRFAGGSHPRRGTRAELRAAIQARGGWVAQ